MRFIMIMNLSLPTPEQIDRRFKNNVAATSISQNKKTEVGLSKSNDITVSLLA